MNICILSSFLIKIVNNKKENELDDNNARLAAHSATQENENKNAKFLKQLPVLNPIIEQN